MGSPRELLHYAFVLAVICIGAALGVSATHALTKDRIAEKARKTLAEARSAVVPTDGDAPPAFEIVSPEAKEDDQVVRALDASGNVLAYAATGEAQGYSSRIKVMVGVDPLDHTIIGIKLVYQQETPGLGTRIAEVKSDKTVLALLTGKQSEEKTDPTPEFLKQFIGKTWHGVTLQPQSDDVDDNSGASHTPYTSTPGKIDALSGATISSRGTVAAVRNAMEKMRDELTREDQ